MISQANTNFIFSLVVKGICLLFCNVVLIAFSKAQISNLSYLSTEDGLSQGLVFDLTQSRDGFLWIGTKNGLNRFDGYAFKTYFHTGDSLSISSSEVTAIFQDSKDRMWVGTRSNGLNYFDVKKGFFYLVENANLKANSSIWEISESEEGQLIVGSFPMTITTLDLNDLGDCVRNCDKEISQLPSKQNTIAEDFKHSSFYHNLNFIHVDQNYFYLTGGLGLYLLDIETLTFNLIDLPQNRRGKGVYSIKRLDDGRFAVGGLGEVMIGREKDWSLIALNDSKLKVRSIGETKEHVLVNAYNQNFTIRKNDFKVSEIDALSGKVLMKMFEDNADNTWMGSNGLGLIKYSPVKDKFKTEFKGVSIQDLYQDNDDIVWAQLPDGFEEVKTFSSENNFLPKYNSSRGSAVSLTQVSDGTYWQLVDRPNQQALLMRCSKNQSDYDPFPIKTNVNFQSSITLFKNKIVIGGTNGDVGFYDIKSKDERIYQLNDLLKSDELITCNQVVVKGDRILLALNVGFAVMYIGDEGASANLLYEGHIHHFQLDDKGHILLSSKEDGLIYINSNGEIIDQVDMLDGLESQEVYGTLSYKDDQWISTNTGLARWNKNKKNILYFNQKDGLSSTEFNSGSIIQSPEGLMYFGGVHGLTRFNPKDVIPSEFDPNNTILNISIKGKLVQASSVGKPLSLKYDRNIVTIDFASLDLTSPDKTVYKYKVKGLNKDWTKIGNNRSVTLGPLLPSSYTFQVLGTNSSGKWSSKPAEFSFVINPPWWKTKLAYLAYLISFLSLVYYLYKSQLHKMRTVDELIFNKNEAKRYADLEKAKSNFFSNITHEFRTPLTLILEPIRQLISEKDNRIDDRRLDLAYANSEKLLDLVNSLLDLSKIESGLMKLDLSVSDIEEHVFHVRDSFAMLSDEKDLELNVNSSLTEKILRYDVSKMDKILYNLLSNAIKFTEKGSISLDVDKKEDRLLIKVKDSGVGIPQDKASSVFDRFEQVENGKVNRRKGTGIGLSLVKEFVELMEGDVHVESTLGKGSAFTVNIPWRYTKDTPLASEITKVVKPLGAINPHENVEVSETDHKPILIIAEDNEELLSFLSSSLQSDYKIIGCENGQIALQKAKELIPDIIISDVMMPEMDGVSLTTAIKNDPGTSHIPVILLTAKSSIDARLEGIHSGVDAYLTKPFSILEVKAYIDNILAQRRALWQAYQVSENPQEIVEKVVDPFIDEIQQIIDRYLGDESLNVNVFLTQLHVSRTQLHRKLKALTGKSITEFVRSYRLDKALKLIRNSDEGISQIAYQCGFSNPSYFSTKFKERFGKAPSEMR